MKILVLAGGKGTRLWPLSRSTFPKQFLSIGDEWTLMQRTIQRYLSSFNAEDFLILTHQDYYHVLKHQLDGINPALSSRIFLEPSMRNTGPAIAYAIKSLLEKGEIHEDSCILVTPSDQLISNTHHLIESIFLAQSAAKKGYHLIFGIEPTRPETGFGYIKFQNSEEGGAIFNVHSFVEKPSRVVAEQMVQSKNYLWNSGLFVFHVQSFIDDIKIHCPEFGAYFDSAASLEKMTREFNQLPRLSIDQALMEKSKKIKAIPLYLSWSDLGSWDSVYETMDKDANLNVKIGNVIAQQTRDSLILGNKRMITTIGIEGLIVIDTEDALLIAKKGESQEIKAVVESLTAVHGKESEESHPVHRPWGHYTVIEKGERFKVKRIFVLPFQKLSLQIHRHRSEHWVVVKGRARASLDNSVVELQENESFFIPKQSKHRLENPSTEMLEIIEVQVGDNLSEEDIIRFDDDYGRVEPELAAATP